MLLSIIKLYYSRVVFSGNQSRQKWRSYCTWFWITCLWCPHKEDNCQTTASFLHEVFTCLPLCVWTACHCCHHCLFSHHQKVKIFLNVALRIFYFILLLLHQVFLQYTVQQVFYWFYKWNILNYLKYKFIYTHTHVPTYI